MLLRRLRARLSGISLRWRLISLVLAALVPALLIVLDHERQDREETIAAAQTRALRLARVWAQNHDGLVREASLLLEAAKREPAVLDPRNARCGDALHLLAQQARWPSAIAVIDPGGFVRCASDDGDAVPHNLPVAFVEDLFGSRGVEVSEFQIDRHGRSMAFAGMRLPSLRGRSDRAVVAVIDLAEIQRRTAREAGGAQYDVTVVGRTGLILTHDPPTAGFVGTAIGEHPLMTKLGYMLEGAAIGHGRDGVERLFAFTQLPQTGAKIIVGLSREDVLGAQERGSNKRLAILGAVAALTLGAAWLLAEFAVVRWVRVLGRAAEAFGRGDLDHRAIVAPGAGEFAALADAFNRMARTIETRSVALLAGEKRFRDIADVAGDFFWETDAKGRYTFLSERFTEVTGVPASAILGKRADELPLVLDGDGADNVPRAFAQREPFRSEILRMILPGGELRWWRISGKPFFDEKTGAFCGYRGAGSEVTAEQSAEAELRVAKEAAEAANRAKSEFLATMSHELRTPLNAVIGFSEIIHKEMFGPVGVPSYRTYAGDILTSGRHLLAVINDILDFAKTEAGSLQLELGEVDLAQLVHGTVRAMQPHAAEAKVQLRVADAPAGLLIRGDERRLRQVLLNLVGNAIKFTPAGGHVEASSGRTAEGEPCLVVRDTGIGIAEKDLPHVIEPFRQADAGHTREHDGTGLGLAICDRLVALHGGKLAIASRVGEGTVVRVVLPRDRLAPASPPAREHGLRVIGGGRA
ncbi:MAG TPA: ATP-binding protein [Stellaceae bacterium]|nr:ATP-binding protein [Stellaceae bacterium]